MTSYAGDVMTASPVTSNNPYISSPSPPQPQGSVSPLDNNNHPPRYGTKVPNRIFVGGIDSTTRDLDLAELFSGYGQVKSAKVIADRAGVSKGYGFVTFFTEKDAQNLMNHKENITLNQRKLNIAPAVKKQYDITDRPYDCVPIQPAPYQPMNAAVYQTPYIYSSPAIPYYIPPVHIPQMPVTDVAAYQAYGLPGVTSPMGPQSTTPYSMMYMPHGAVYMASPPQLHQYQQMSPSAAWVDSGMNGQFQITSTLPYSVPMY